MRGYFSERWDYVSEVILFKASFLCLELEDWLQGIELVLLWVKQSLKLGLHSGWKVKSCPRAVFAHLRDALSVRV